MSSFSEKMWGPGSRPGLGTCFKEQHFAHRIWTLTSAESSITVVCVCVCVTDQGVGQVLYLFFDQGLQFCVGHSALRQILQQLPVW